MILKKCEKPLMLTEDIHAQVCNSLYENRLSDTS